MWLYAIWGNVWFINLLKPHQPSNVWCWLLYSSVKKREPEPYVAPPVRSPSPMTKESPTKSKRGDKGKEKATPEPPAQVGGLGLA